MTVSALPSEPDFERTPPQDVPAEQCALGGMLLSKDAIADVIEVLRPGDFYRPTHQTVYDALLDLYGRGEPADPVTVAAELTKRGELARVGGAPYLHTLISSVPTAANAGYYAKIVRERAILRRLVEAGTRIVQLGYAGEGGEVDELVDRAQAEVYSVTERRTGEDYVRLDEIMPSALDEIEAIGSRGGAMVGVPTGFADLDGLTNGLHPGQMVIVAARPAVGKALALDTPLPTPDGWTTMGEVEVGDRLIAADGSPTTVLRATDVMPDRPCYEVIFDDGTCVIADAEHQWLTDTRASRRSAQAAATGYNRTRNQRTFASVKTTQEIAETVRCRTADQRLGRVSQSLPSRAGTSVDASRGEGGRRTGSAPTDDNEARRRAGLAQQVTGIGRHDLNHAVANAAPIEVPERELPLPPYFLGTWLGDGHTKAARITTCDPEILAYVEGGGLVVTPITDTTYGVRLPGAEPAERSCAVCGETFRPRASQVRTCGQSCGDKARFVSDPVPVPTCPDCGRSTSGGLRCQECTRDHGSVQATLRSIGVLGDKHIPTAYLRSSPAQRRALLAGLLDTDGTVTRTGSVQFAVTNQRLAADFCELLASLGYRCGVSTKLVRGRSAELSIAYTVTFTTSDDVFALERKKLLHKERRPDLPGPRTRSRFITSVRPVASVPVRCVEVDHAEHLYLATRSMIPTHNSTLGLDFARAASIRNGLTSVIFSMEMSRSEITMRLLSAEARVPLHHMRSGMMTDDDWTRLARYMSEAAEAPLFIDDSPNMTMMEIRAKCRRLKQRHDLRLVVVDYMQLMMSPRKVESRQQEVSELSRSLKLLAKELDVPVIAISQLNRGPEQRTDKKPQLADLRESGSLEQDSDVVLLLYREDAFERESPRAGEADLILAKHRNGPTATVTVAFQGHYSRFVDMAPT